eukprot:TRINITY_DN11436_c0_g1_i2.p1 TRINITY_DN11436_c0_g1~~TRINITY_DN11436_c0_g1_i2.p1  ORF type:complete len:257 (+),score=34.91 TRINITY_DN11436_c0_g1_i2:1098-1868(+)
MIYTLSSAIGTTLVAACACFGLDWSLPTLQAILMVGNLAFIPTAAVLFMYREALPTVKEDASETMMAASKATSIIPYLVTACEFITCVGAGMTVKFFNLFFIEDFHFSPAQINLLAGTYVLTIAAFMKGLQLVSKRIGRAQASFVAFLLNGLLFLLLAKIRSLPLLLLVFLVRGGLSNATGPIDKSILMDFTPSSTRGRWNAVSSIASATWSGSAFLGGYLSDAHGYRWTFFVTGLIYLCSCVLYAPLLWLVPRKE